MSNFQDAWFIFVHKDNGSTETEVAHFIPKGATAAICGIALPFDISDMEPWRSTNPQHIHEIRQHQLCQSAIAKRDGRRPMVIDAPKSRRKA